MNHSIPISDLHCDTAMGLAAGRTLDDPRASGQYPCHERCRDRPPGLRLLRSSSLPKGRKFDFASKMLDALEKQMGVHGADVTICRNSDEALAARASGRIAAILAVENGDALEGDLKNLEKFQARGVRLLTLVHSRSNRWIISCGDKAPSFDGLARFGEEVVTAINKLGMIIDVSHAHDVAVEKILEQSGQPIVASHSCAYTLCPTPRNLKDPLIKKIAKGGGLVGVNIYPGLLDAGYTRASEKLSELFSEIDGGRRKGRSRSLEASRGLYSFRRAFPQGHGSLPGSAGPLPRAYLLYAERSRRRPCGFWLGLRRGVRPPRRRDGMPGPSASSGTGWPKRSFLERA